MARIETWFEQDLKKPVIVHKLDSVFSQDAKGNLIGVKVFSDGVAVALTDSITGYCVLADGSTVPVSGSKSGNQASIILPASAYNVLGPIMITVKNTGSDYATTLCAVAGLVVRSRTGSQVDPGSVVTDWTNQISAQLQAVQTAADNLGSVLAVPFSNSTAYSAGNYVMKDGNLYCFTTDHAAGDWNSSQVRSAKLADDVRGLKSAISDTEYAVQTGFLSPSVWANGSWSDGSSPTPQLTNATNRIRPNNFINVYKGDTVSIDNASLYGHAVGVWRGKLGSASNVRSDQSFNTNNEKFSISEDGFIIVVFADASNPSTNLDLATFTGSIAIDTYASKEIQKTNNSIGLVISKGDNRLVYSDDVVNNIICPYDVKRGYYVDTSGVERASADWSVTDYIPIVGGESLYFGNTGLTCFYDESYSFVSYRTGSYTSYTVPNTAAFMKVSILITALSTAAVNRGSVPKPYDDGIIHYNNRFKPFESGYIYFTVPVNQKNWNRNANMGTNRATLDAQDWVDVNCYIKLPGTYTKSGQPTKLLMLCHGAGKGIKTTDSDDNWCGYEHYDNLVNAFIANGYAVFDCNGYDNIRYACSFWGNRRGVQAWKNAYQYIIDNYNVEHQFSIYAFSMGGLTAMAIASDLYPNIKCMALGSPVTSLKAMWDSGNNAVIADIYGMASTAVYEEDKVLGCDPQESIITINNTDYFMKQLPPVKAWFGTLETQPSPTDCSKMINAIKNTNGIAQLRMVDNATHSICFGAEPLITAEYVMWINRWNSIGRHN